MARRKRNRAVSKPEERAKVPEILNLIASGKSLKSICEAYGFPPISTFLTWVSQDEELQTQYRAAMAIRADVQAEEIIDIASDTSRDFVEIIDDETGEYRKVMNPHAVQRAKLEIDARKWLMAKTAPAKYGEKIDLNHGGKVKVVSLTSDDEAI